MGLLNCWLGEKVEAIFYTLLFLSFIKIATVKLVSFSSFGGKNG